MKKFGLMILVFLVTVFICLCTGRYPISPGHVVGLLLSGAGIESHGFAAPPEMMMIFWNIRVPRILLSIMIGAGISISGAVFQALFRNPLAAPDILGVTAGSCFGAALAIMFLTPLAWVIQTSAFIFGIVAVTLAYILASWSRDSSPSVLVISGIVISAVFQAGLSFIMYLANPYDQMAQIVFWIMGSFHMASWTKVQVTLPVLVPGIFLMTIFSWRLNIMTQGEEDVLSMGINIFRWRIFYVLVSTLMVACAVASVGTVAWIGLIVPHIARYLAGAEHSRLIPVTAVLGGVFLMVMDSVARSVMLSEIPISIVTSIFGAPFLGYLVISAGQARFGHESGR
ncbi:MULTISPECIES: FecCD family ABC transporter permease [Desulfobacula]|uniref:Predicted iron ABC transporter, permease protein n=2 Tax=Desulfobacula TaxID=28222 RepID=K0NGX4_DESTT|nr:MULTISPECIES: iron ABC transporter permease [Desulfobacula]CCK79093.1 predicted iron ABC transporter, permease protein [Desulfobacula toluolica Tol2]SDU07119.1 iron complex transport system permease protein [Desulfobacula phenolica]